MSFSNPIPCDAVLIPTSINLQESSSIKLAILNITGEDNYEQQKKNYGATVPGYFDGSFDDFKEKRDKTFKESNYDLSVIASRSVLMSFLPEYVVKAWSECIASQAAAGQLQAWVSSADEFGATVRVRWIKGPGLTYLSKTEVVLSSGKVISDLFSPNEQFEGEVSIYVQRPEPYASTRGTVSGESNGGSFSCDFDVPRYPRLTEKTVTERHQFGTQPVGTYTTKSYPRGAHLSIYGEATSEWEPRNDGYHWVHCILRRDGKVFDYSGEKSVPENGVGLARTQTLEIDVPPGAQLNLQVDTDNAGSKARSLDLIITAQYEVME